MKRLESLLYIAAIALGVLLGAIWGNGATHLESWITPLLAVLLYVTFLDIPFTRIRESLKDHRFLGAIVVANFVVVPAIAWLLSTLVSSRVVTLGVLIVLLTPCIDYVVTFTGLGGGDRARLLAVTPVLMLLQMAMLPLYLWLFGWSAELADMPLAPFVHAFIWIIAVPLLAAVATRAVVPTRAESLSAKTMIPLMIATLLVVAASQTPRLDGQWNTVWSVVPLYVLFVLAMWALASGVGRVFSLPEAQGQALRFSAVTRNSLVVLPLVLALPAGYELVPAVVVTQTLVELVLLVGIVSLLGKSPVLARP